MFNVPASFLMVNPRLPSVISHLRFAASTEAVAVSERGTALLLNSFRNASERVPLFKSPWNPDPTLNNNSAKRTLSVSPSFLIVNTWLSTSGVGLSSVISHLWPASSTETVTIPDSIKVTAFLSNSFRKTSVIGLLPNSASNSDPRLNRRSRSTTRP